MDTVCNFTNHSYFNFSGVKNVCNYIVSVGADYYTPVDSSNIPTGDILPVEGTMMISVVREKLEQIVLISIMFYLMHMNTPLK